MVSISRVAGFSVVVIGACGAHSSALLPLLIEYVIRHNGFSETSAGFFGTVGLLGSAISIVSLSILSTRLQRPSVGLMAAGVLCVSNIICALSSSLASLLLLRFVAGMAEGVLLSLMTGFIARSSSPERMFGAFFFIHNGLTFLVMSNWERLITLRVGGIMGPFAILAGIATLAAIFVPFYPPAKSVPTPLAERRPRVVRKNVLPASIGLSGVFMFNVAAMGVWSFIVPFAHNLGLTDSSIQTMLVVSNFTGFAGAIVPLLFGRLFGGTIPILLGFGAMALVSFFAGLGAPPMLILVGGQVFSFAWVMLNPYISGAIAVLDSDGRFAVLSFAVLYLGLALGPALTGWLSDTGLPLATVFFGFAIVFIVSCAAILTMDHMARPLIAKAI